MTTALRFTLLPEQPTEEAPYLGENGGGGARGTISRTAPSVAAIGTPYTPPVKDMPPIAPPPGIPVDVTITESLTPSAEPVPLATLDKVPSMIGPQPLAGPAIPSVQVSEGQKNYLTMVGLVLAVLGIGVAVWAATRGK